MADPRPPIEEHIKREVRQQCRFGCVICGCPVYHYDHIVEYSKVQAHDVENLALLCATHHDQKTRKHLPADAVKHAKDQIAAGTRPATRGSDLFFGENILLILGSNSFRLTVEPGEPVVPALVVEETTLIGLRLEEGRPLLTLKSFDEDNRLVLNVRDNELRHTAHLWDVTYVGTVLTFRRARGDILLEVDFRAPDAIEFTRGTIYACGIGLAISPDRLTVLNSQNALINVHGENKGIRFGESESPSDLIGIDILGVTRHQYFPAPRAFNRRGGAE